MVINFKSVFALICCMILSSCGAIEDWLWNMEFHEKVHSAKISNSHKLEVMRDSTAEHSFGRIVLKSKTGKILDERLTGNLNSDDQIRILTHPGFVRVDKISGAEHVCIGVINLNSNRVHTTYNTPGAEMDRLEFLFTPEVTGTGK